MNDINQNLQELWGKVGFIIHLSQMVEYNLANILSADELLREFEERDVMCIIEYNKFAEKSNALYQTLSTKTFGAILNRAEKIKFFTDMYNKLGVREICEKRIESLFAMCDDYIDRISVPEEKKANLKAFANSLLNRKL